MWKNVHTAYGAGIRTHDLQNMSLLPLPLDQILITFLQRRKIEVKKLIKFNMIHPAWTPLRATALLAAFTIEQIALNGDSILYIKSSSHGSAKVLGKKYFTISKLWRFTSGQSLTFCASFRFRSLAGNHLKCQRRDSNCVPLLRNNNQCCWLLCQISVFNSRLEPITCQQTNHNKCSTTITEGKIR